MAATWKAACALACAIGIAGCAGGAKQVDEHWGPKASAGATGSGECAPDKPAVAAATDPAPGTNAGSGQTAARGCKP